jgi:hypothetical protein
MERGRAKAMQTKVARELKYSTGSLDPEALKRELASQGGGLGTHSDELEDVDDEDDLDDEDED